MSSNSPYARSNFLYNHPLMMMGLGAVPGYSRMSASGNNPNVTTGVLPEDVWYGTSTYPWPAVAGTMTLVSDNAADTMKVQVTVLRADYSQDAQTVTLAGLTPVTVPGGPVLRINGLMVVTAGATGNNQGMVTASIGGTVLAYMPPGIGVVRQAIYTVPAGYTLHLTTFLLSVDRASGTSPTFSTIGLGYRTPAGVVRFPIEVGFSNSAPYLHSVVPGNTFSEKTDVFLRIFSVSPTVKVTGAMVGILMDNTYL